jgi:hypothetical protein
VTDVKEDWPSGQRWRANEGNKKKNRDCGQSGGLVVRETDQHPGCNRGEVETGLRGPSVFASDLLDWRGLRYVGSRNQRKREIKVRRVAQPGRDEEKERFGGAQGESGRGVGCLWKWRERRQGTEEKRE